LKSTATFGQGSFFMSFFEISYAQYFFCHTVIFCKESLNMFELLSTVHNSNYILLKITFKIH